MSDSGNKEKTGWPSTSNACGESQMYSTENRKKRKEVLALSKLSAWGVDVEFRGGGLINKLLMAIGLI